MKFKLPTTLFIAFFSLVLFIFSSFTSFLQKSNSQKSNIICDENGCQGIYVGPEFVLGAEGGSDVAHQFSNTMCWRVGDELKALYADKKYSRVDFKNIEMSTVGMGSGTVEYFLRIPFERVEDPCDAYTSFDHVGGWNHTPALTSRKKQLEGVILPGESLYISDLKTTPEGLEEYWIQWNNAKVQADCAQ
ncbi:MAG: hypothetical protein SchgKO_21430 [Schleiferiaceae bacterium]